MGLFEVTDVDRRVYETQLRDFLPDDLIDIHTHIWRGGPLTGGAPGEPRRTVLWPEWVAAQNPVGDLIETYRRMFPGKRVTPLMFANCGGRDATPAANRYVRDCAAQTGYPALYYSLPEQDPDELEEEITSGGYFGVKSYLDLAPSYIPEGEIRIFDFFPPAQLHRLSKMGKIVMLHIPRPGRLRDPVNLNQMMEIERNFPGVRLIVAHIGRAYTEHDLGDAFDALSGAKNMMFDFSANTCVPAMRALIRAVGPERVLFGSDLPILRMRMRRVEENKTYVNLVPPGLYGEPGQDPHLRAVSAEEGAKLTFFMYEEILAFRRAAEAVGLSSADVQRVFYGNARALLDAVQS